MPAVLNTNAASLYASKNLQSAQSRMATSVEHLSSGLRVNRARDDAAGLGIANSLTSQINSANQGVRNLNDGISMVQTAEGAIGAAQEMGQRIVTLSTQALNGTLGLDQRKAVRQEMRQLMSAIESINDRTKFSSSSSIFSQTITATGTVVSLQAGKDSTDSISLAASAFRQIGVGDVSGDAAKITTNAVNTSTDFANGQGSALMIAINTVLDADLVAGSFTAIQAAADSYVSALTTQRSLLGAYQNQIEFSVSNVNELSSNLSAARSNVVDTDYAAETANLTKGQILQQAATAMLAQANQMPNVILSLLK
jgi:flagellin